MTPIKTATLSDIDSWVNMLFYGNEGTGKTTDLATMANLGRVMFINAESGIEAKPLRKRGINTDNIEVFPDPNDANERITFDALESIYWQMKSDLADDPSAWIGTCWDSGTEIVKLLLEDVVGARVEKAEDTKSRGKTVSEMLLNRFFSAQDDYGEMSGQVRWLLRRFRDLPCHFGIACLQRRDVDQDDSKVHYGPAVTPAVQTDMLGWMKIVCRTEALVEDGQDVFIGHFRAEGKYRGKDRLAALPPVLRDPTFERVVGYVNGTLSEQDEEQEVPRTETIQQRRKRLAEQQRAKASSAQGAQGGK